MVLRPDSFVDQEMQKAVPDMQVGKEMDLYSYCFLALYFVKHLESDVRKMKSYCLHLLIHPLVCVQTKLDPNPYSHSRRMAYHFVCSYCLHTLEMDHCSMICSFRQNLAAHRCCDDETKDSHLHGFCEILAVGNQMNAPYCLRWNHQMNFFDCFC